MGANRFPDIPEINALDFRAPDLHAQSLAIHEAFGVPRKVALDALRETLTDEQLEHLYTLLDATQERGRVEGVQLAVSKLRKIKNVQKAAQVPVEAPPAPLTPDARLQLRVKALETEVAAQKTELDRMHQELWRKPSQVTLNRKPNWDYAQVEARPARPDEQPVPVEREKEIKECARVIEAFVLRRGGKCLAGDARQAAKAYTAVGEALKYLHLSGRVVKRGTELWIPHHRRPA